MNILAVVEDDRDMQLLIEVTLAADDRIRISGHATTAEEAVVLARELQPELIVLDHFIDGEIMGLEAAPQLKEVAPDARILLFTSHDLHTEARREPAVDEFLLKRDLGQLLPSVQRLLGMEPVGV